MTYFNRCSVLVLCFFLSIVLWMGDLNYRLDTGILSDLEIRRLAVTDYRKLLPMDQVRNVFVFFCTEGGGHH